MNKRNAFIYFGIRNRKRIILRKCKNYKYDKPITDLFYLDLSTDYNVYDYLCMAC